MFETFLLHHVKIRKLKTHQSGGGGGVCLLFCFLFFSKLPANIKKFTIFSNSYDSSSKLLEKRFSSSFQFSIHYSSKLSRQDTYDFFYRHVCKSVCISVLNTGRIQIAVSKIKWKYAVRKSGKEASIKMISYYDGWSQSVRFCFAPSEHTLSYSYSRKVMYRN